MHFYNDLNSIRYSSITYKHTHTHTLDPVLLRNRLYFHKYSWLYTYTYYVNDAVLYGK